MEWFTYTGVEDIPDHVTHVFVDVTVVRRITFHGHPNIVEVVCHGKVEKIEGDAFSDCRSLRRLIMPGVEIVGEGAFHNCPVLTDVECGKLERIGIDAFGFCASLRSIDLPSAEVVEENAFRYCDDLTDVIFGRKLERLEWGAFRHCLSLGRITFPLKDGMIPHDDIFEGCKEFNHVDLIERALLQETIAALHFEGWREDMREEIDSINQILPNADSGHCEEGVRPWVDPNGGEKAQAIRTWIRSVLGKVIHYKAEHGSVLDDAATTLQFALPRDIVMNNVLPFLALPSHTFEGEEEEGGADDNMM